MKVTRIFVERMRKWLQEVIITSELEVARINDIIGIMEAMVCPVGFQKREDVPPESKKAYAMEMYEYVRLLRNEPLLFVSDWSVEG